MQHVLVSGDSQSFSHGLSVKGGIQSDHGSVNAFTRKIVCKLLRSPTENHNAKKKYATKKKRSVLDTIYMEKYQQQHSCFSCIFVSYLSYQLQEKYADIKNTLVLFVCILYEKTWIIILGNRSKNLVICGIRPQSGLPFLTHLEVYVPDPLHHSVTRPNNRVLVVVLTFCPPRLEGL